MAETTITNGKLLKAGQVAAILNVSLTQVYRLFQEDLPCVRFGKGTVRVRQDDLDQYITGHLDNHISHSQVIK